MPPLSIETSQTYYKGIHLLVFLQDMFLGSQYKTMEEAIETMKIQISKELVTHQYTPACTYTSIYICTYTHIVYLTIHKNPIKPLALIAKKSEERRA